MSNPHLAGNAFVLFCMLVTVASCQSRTPEGTIPAPQQDTMSICLNYEIKMMTYNLAGKETLYGDPDGVIRSVANRIRDEGLHVVALQELEINSTRHDGANMKAMMINQLAAINYPMEGAFQMRFEDPQHDLVPYDTDEDAVHGIMVLSRQPLDDYHGYRLKWVDAGGGQWFAVLQAFRYETPCGPVRIFNLHNVTAPFNCLAMADPVREDILDIVHQYDDEMSFFLGDFNIQADDPCLDGLYDTYVDICAEQVATGKDASCQHTATGHGSDFDIDHIFIRPPPAGGYAQPWTVRDFWVDHQANEPLLISDHYPLIGGFSYGGFEQIRGIDHVVFPNQRIKQTVLLDGGSEVRYRFADWDGRAYGHWTHWTAEWGDLGELIPGEGDQQSFRCFDQIQLPDGRTMQTVVAEDGRKDWYRYADWVGDRYARWTPWDDTWGDLTQIIPGEGDQQAFRCLDQVVFPNGQLKQTLLCEDGAKVWYRYADWAGDRHTNWTEWIDEWGDLTALISGRGSAQSFRSFDQIRLPDDRAQQTVVEEDGTTAWIRTAEWDGTRYVRWGAWRKD